jgi:hypothetical protein
MQTRIMQRRLFGAWGALQAQKIGQQSGAFVFLDHTTRAVTLYGTEAARASAGRLLTEALGRVSTKLVGHLQPAFIKYLLKTYGYHLDGLRMACDAVAVGLRGTSLLLEGEESVLHAAMQTISTEQAVLSQVPLPGDMAGGSGTEKCAVCSDSLGADCVYPSLCGHGHCLECMQALIHTATSERKLPLTCGFWDCDSILAIRDVQSICDEAQWAQVVGMATATLLQGSDSIQACPTPGCPAVYRRQREREVPQNSLRCPECGHQLCPVCNTDAHPGILCSQLPEL